MNGQALWKKRFLILNYEGKRCFVGGIVLLAKEGTMVLVSKESVVLRRQASEALSYLPT